MIAVVLLILPPILIGATCALIFNRSQSPRYLLCCACYLLAGFVIPYALDLFEIQSDLASTVGM